MRTESEKSYGPRMDRRAFLVFLSAVSATLACSPDNPLLQLPAPVGIRREIGEWSRLDVESLAQSMIAEIEFRDLVFAGQLLLDNQQGKPSLSAFSPLFADAPIRITTLNQITNKTPALEHLPALLQAIIYEPPVQQGIQLKIKDGQSLVIIPNSTKLYFNEIRISDDFARQFSDFQLKFFIAKEIYNISAFDLASSYVAENLLIPSLEIPPEHETDILKALQLHALHLQIDVMPVYFMADLWAHFLLVPAYLRAREKNMFSDEQLNSPVMTVFKIAAEAFQRDGILTRNEQGLYEWMASEDFYDRLFDFALLGAKIFLNSKPQT